jgi:NADH-quinone oxidoreductase subunit G
VPAAFGQQQGWRVAPYYHLFGSDEMSQRSGVIQQRMPDAYVMVNPTDAAALGVNAGALVEFSCAGQTLRLPVRLSETLAQGQVGLPLGLPGISPVLVGATVENLREATR